MGLLACGRNTEGSIPSSPLTNNHTVAVFLDGDYLDTLHVENQDEQYSKGNSPTESFKRSEWKKVFKFCPDCGKRIDSKLRKELESWL